MKMIIINFYLNLFDDIEIRIIFSLYIILFTNNFYKYFNLKFLLIKIYLKIVGNFKYIFL